MGAATRRLQVPRLPLSLPLMVPMAIPLYARRSSMRPEMCTARRMKAALDTQFVRGSRR